MRAKFFAAIAEFDISLSGSQFLAELQTFLITNKGHTHCWLKILSKAHHRSQISVFFAFKSQ
jgi:hypothetical protein